MLSLSRAFLLPLLIVVQFFAPLLHAHTGSMEPYHGVHLPGLEAYGDAAEHAQASAHHHGDVCLIVAVDDGIKEQHAGLNGPARDCAALPMLLRYIFQADTTPLPYAKLPDPRPPLSLPHPLPLSPRAPPAR